MGAAHPVEPHLGGRHLRHRPLAPAVRAAVAAEVAEVDRLVGVGGAAVTAVLGVGGVLHARQRLRVVLDTEIGHAGSRPRPRSATSGSSAFSTKRARPSSRRDQLRPAVREQLQLAVAVELVAEEVGEEQEAGLHLVGHAREPRLVDLEQPELAALPAGVEQRGRDAPRHVRAGPVVNHRTAVALEAGGDHRGGGRLAVRGREEHGAGRELAWPCSSSSRGRCAAACRPGAVVPPLRPLRRLAARTSRARLRAGRYISLDR